MSLTSVSPCLQQTLETLDPVYCISAVAGPGQAGHDHRERLPLPHVSKVSHCHFLASC